MHEPDAERTEGRPDPVTMLLLGVRVRVEVEVPVPPADEEADGEEDDERRDGRLGPLLEALGQVALGEQDRDAEEDQRDGVAEAPPGAEPRGRPRRTLAARRDQRRHRGDVVGVGRVPEPEEHRDEEDDDDRRPVGEACDPVVEPEHAPGSPAPPDRFAQTTPGTARAVITMPTPRIRAALTAGNARATGPSRESRPKAAARAPRRGRSR